VAAWNFVQPPLITLDQHSLQLQTEVPKLKKHLSLAHTFLQEILKRYSNVHIILCVFEMQKVVDSQNHFRLLFLSLTILFESLPFHFKEIPLLTFFFFVFAAKGGKFKP